MNRRRVLSGLLSLACSPLLASIPALALEGDGATQFTDGLLQQVVGGIAGRKLQRSECNHLFRGMVERYVDLPGTSAAVLGRTWARLSDNDRQRFEVALVNYMTAVWAEHLTEFSPERRFIVQRSERQGDRLIVHAITVAPGDDPVSLEFLINAGPDGRPLLGDVAFAGISVVRMLRSDFNSVLFANSGRIEALFAAMQRKVELAAVD